MTEWNPPALCLSGHPMKFPNVEVKFDHCGCSIALADRSPSGPPGHQYMRCSTCRWTWYAGGHDESYVPVAERPRVL